MGRINRRGSPDSPVYTARTGDILVRVSPAYTPEESSPDSGRWIWIYTVEIENHGQDTVTLVSRHWIITDGLNRVEEVRGLLQGEHAMPVALRRNAALWFSQTGQINCESG